MILLQNDLATITIFSLQTDFMIVPPGFVALFIYGPFHILKMTDWTDNQFMNLFAKFR